MNSVQQQSPDPIIQLTFLAFFPAVFLILLIYFMSEAIIREHAGMRVLLGVAVYLFIIFYGWYHYALIISKLWFISIIILGGLGIFIHRMTGGGGGGAGLRSGGGGLGGTAMRYLGKRIGAKLSGREEDVKGSIKREFSFLAGLKKQLLNPDVEERAKAYAFARAAESINRVEGYIGELDELHSVESGVGRVRIHRGEIEDLRKMLQKVIDEIGRGYKPARKLKRAA
jgi:hypothetical protein